MELIDLHELESNLVYFDTSLRANKVVLDRLMRYNRIKKYPEDQDLLDDVVVENQQAIEMTRIYRDIIQGTRELLSSLMDNRLNSAMKYLCVDHDRHGDPDDNFRHLRNERFRKMDAAGPIHLTVPGLSAC